MTLLAFHDGRRRATGDQRSSLATSFGSQVDDPIGTTDDIDVVFDHDD